MGAARMRSPARGGLRPGPLALLAAAAALSVGACGGGDRDRAAVAPPEAPLQEGTYKVGRPYEIDGITYRPAVDEAYDEIGIASWYGPKFHGRRTGNGEFFDMNAVSAAHRTLPMPSIVRVSNLENGRALTIRINDRGPYVRGRIIDLSRRAAQLLGFRYKGTAEVRVRILAEESRRAAALAKLTPRPPAIAGPAADGVVFEPLPSDTGPVETVALAAPGEAPAPAPAGEGVYIQAGAFLDPENANRLKARLARFGRAAVAPRGEGPMLYRVLLGPFADIARARSLIGAVSAASRAPARIVPD